MNGSQSIATITFTIYAAFGLYNVALASFVLLLYLSGLCINLLLVAAICVEPQLHRPMYVLLVHLALSGVLGSSSVCPSMVKHLMSSKRESSVEGCLTQVFLNNLYGGSIFCVLALMAYDRYISICRPLLYHAIMTPAKLRLMLASVYSVLTLVSAVQVFLISRLPLCRNAVDKLICDNLTLANLSCQKTNLISVYGLVCALCIIVLPCLLFILSYVHIFTVVLRASTESQRKAMQTCTPQLVTFSNFCVATFFGFISNRRSDDGVPSGVNIFQVVSFFVVPSLLHPIIYGIKMKAIRKSIKKMLRGKVK